MKVRHRKGIANHPDPESCGGVREGATEALTGESAGQPLVTRTNGRFTVLRLTSSKRMRATLKALRQTLKRRKHEPIPVIGKWLRRVIQGYFNYHAVPGNSWRLSTFRKEVGRAWLHALRRRGQHGRVSWVRFMRYVARYIPLVRVLHPYPNQRFTS